jgi:hypothetical protein
MIFTLENPARTKITYIHLNDTDHAKHQDLHNIDGCKEWYINDTESLVVVKYDEKVIDEETIRKILN